MQFRVQRYLYWEPRIAVEKDVCLKRVATLRIEYIVTKIDRKFGILFTKVHVRFKTTFRVGGKKYLPRWKKMSASKEIVKFIAKFQVKGIVIRFGLKVANVSKIRNSV